jgi:hypothetical protein
MSFDDFFIHAPNNTKLSDGPCNGLAFSGCYAPF